MKSILFIGMDVHKNTFSLCCYCKESGEILREVKCAAEAKLIKKFIDDIKKDLNEDLEFKCGYEAGCLGFSLYKELKALAYSRNSSDSVRESFLKLKALNTLIISIPSFRITIY